mmetsp:Transcript_23565/g.47263  ORF Transcript_23565/g.47263 Transcript_23565/m.47263 type:complete len:160 (-) Transcript_23565:522-1001(-)
MIRSIGQRGRKIKNSKKLIEKYTKTKKNQEKEAMDVSSNGLDSLVFRKFDPFSKNTFFKKKMMLFKKKKESSSLYSEKSQKIIRLLLKNFLTVLGQESSNISFSNGRTVVNQMDILKSNCLREFFQSAKEILGYKERIIRKKLLKDTKKKEGFFSTFRK